MHSSINTPHRTMAGLGLAILFTLSGCRFNPQAAQRVIERQANATAAAAAAKPAEAGSPTDTVKAEAVAAAVPNITATAVATVSDATVPVPATPETAAVVQSRCVVKAADGALVYDTPQASGQLLGTLAARSIFTASGRSADGQWLLAIIPINTRGWVFAPSSGCSIPVEELAASDATMLKATPVAVAGATTPAEPVTHTAYLPDVGGVTTPDAAVAAAMVVTATPELAADSEGTLPTPSVSLAAATPDATATAPAQTDGAGQTGGLTQLGCLVTSRRGANLRASAGADGKRVTLLRMRTRFTALARSEDGEWLLGMARGKSGWMAVSTVHCASDPRSLVTR